MPVYDMGMSKNKYGVRVDASILYEIALDIASFTWEQVHDKLNKGQHVLTAMKSRMSDELKHEVELSGRVHTWRSLLFLIHRCPRLSGAPMESHMAVFHAWLNELGDQVISLATPFLAPTDQVLLADALSANGSAQRHLLTRYTDNPVVHENLQYLFTVSPANLVSHIQRLVTGWFQEMFDDLKSLIRTLQIARDDTEQLAAVTRADELIRTVTRGGEFQPEPGSRTLWLIPQIAYRPFTIVNAVQDCSIYYYPVADHHLPRGSEEAVMTAIAAAHKAVGDVQRVRLLKLLRSSPKSLAELAIGIDTSKSTTHHHLLLLRSVGFVSVQGGVYELCPEAISTFGDALLELLQISPDRVR